VSSLGALRRHCHQPRSFFIFPSRNLIRTVLPLRFVRSGEMDLNPERPRGILHPSGNQQQNIRLQSPRNHSLRTPRTPLAPGHVDPKKKTSSILSALKCELSP
ncbi:unnamed protein product, partial [Tenebrio molitor]